MSRSEAKTFESVRREIARRIQAGLPLAGMIAATSLLCGCSERPPRGPIGKMTTKDAPRCEQRSEQPKPKTPPPPKKNGNREVKERPLAGMPKPPPNRKNETDRSPTPGRPAKPLPQRKK